MATMSIAEPPRSRTPKRPDPARVVQSYYHQVDAGGKRGAYRRTGDLYNISDESVRRYVLAFEARVAMPPEPDELVYSPPPDGYPMPQPAPIALILPQQEPQTTPAECGALTSSARSDVAETPQGSNATRHTGEHAPDAEDSPEVPQPPDEEEEPLLPPPVPQSPLPAPAPPPPREEPHAPPGAVPIWAGAPTVQRVVMRAPVERPRSGVLQWFIEHEGARQQLIAVVVFLLLVGLTWL